MAVLSISFLYTVWMEKKQCCQNSEHSLINWDLPNISCTFSWSSAGFDVLVDGKMTEAFCSCFVKRISRSDLAYAQASRAGTLRIFIPFICREMGGGGGDAQGEGMIYSILHNIPCIAQKHLVLFQHTCLPHHLSVSSPPSACSR